MGDNGKDITPRGEELAHEILSAANLIAEDLIKFFDKGQKAAARRCRKNLSAVREWSKEIRAEISKVKNERAAVASED